MTSFSDKLDEKFIPTLKGYEPVRVTFSGRLPGIDEQARVLQMSYPLFKQAIIKLVLDELENPIEYKKYEHCPVCPEKYMYACSCAVAGDYVESFLRKKLDQSKQGDQ